MDIPYLIAHPEELNQDTLYDLRRVVAAQPYYHAARIVFLQNLFLLHDPTFDQELRRAALLIPDRRVLFEITQANVRTTRTAPSEKHDDSKDKTLQMLDDFLDTAPAAPRPRIPVKADPRTDYMAFLLQEEETTEDTQAPTPEAAQATSSTDRMNALIDSFIASQSAGITLSENPMTPEGILDDPDELAEEELTEAPIADAPATPAAPKPTAAVTGAASDETQAGELTEALALIYIKQQKYERAAEVMAKLQDTPSARSNPYFADQVRFLQKLALNERCKNQKQTK